MSLPHESVLFDRVERLFKETRELHRGALLGFDETRATVLDAALTRLRGGPWRVLDLRNDPDPQRALSTIRDDEDIVILASTKVRPALAFFAGAVAGGKADFTLDGLTWKKRRVEQPVVVVVEHALDMEALPRELRKFDYVDFIT